MMVTNYTKEVALQAAHMALILMEIVSFVQQAAQVAPVLHNVQAALQDTIFTKAHALHHAH